MNIVGDIWITLPRNNSYQTSGPVPASLTLLLLSSVHCPITPIFVCITFMCMFLVIV